VAQIDISNGAYTRYTYSATLMRVNSYTLVNVGGQELYSNQILDGAGRVIASRSDHLNTMGHYRGAYFYYDTMGRVFKQSSPTEITSVDVPVGDDADGSSR